MTFYVEPLRLYYVPYYAPRVSKGDRVHCHLRGTAIITSWTDAPIPWPRCRALDARGGGSGLWPDDTLALAVALELPPRYVTGGASPRG